jgi:clan AA aspartic protease
MGLTRLTMTVSNVSDQSRSREVEFLIDSGAVYSLVPREVLSQLGIVPQRVQFFSMVDGTAVQREVGHAMFTFQGQSAPSPVIFGEPGDEPLLGATTLETMGLVLDPFQRELRPMALRL